MERMEVSASGDKTPRRSLKRRLKTAAGLSAAAGVLGFSVGYATTHLTSVGSTLNQAATDVMSAGAATVSFDAASPVESYGRSTRGGAGSGSNELKLDLLNEYGSLTDARRNYQWDYVAEPHRATTLVSVGGKADSVCTWELTDPQSTRRAEAANDGDGEGDSSGAIVVKGCQTGFMFKQTGKWGVTLTESSPEGRRTVKESVMVKYVRREIRTLNDRDRESFFTAAMILQRVPTSVGQRLYGSKYHSKDFFNRIHLYYGGTKDCDHWHKGAGFVTSHMAATLAYEQALQSVFPTVSVPYWDFTLESTFYGNTDFRDSKVFSDDWFGAAAPQNSLHVIAQGRFAFVPTMTDAHKFTDTVNSYGLMKAPWNNDPTPFMTRSSEIYGYENNLKPSGCSEYANAMAQDNWMALSKQLNAAAHGHIHELLGGSWNHNYGARHDFETSPAIYTFAHEILAMSKELWRNGFLECPDTCEMDIPWDECKCSCANSAKIQAAFDANLKPVDVLDQSGVLGGMTFFDNDRHLVSNFVNSTTGKAHERIPGYSVQESHEMYTNMLEDLCEPGHNGDMFQATSSNDITFWVLHPTVDRLWHYKRLAQDPNFDETWDPYHTCYGHNPDDYQPFEDLFSTPAASGSFYSNQEIKDLFHPMHDAVPYMYDHFEWKHCEKLGYDMSNLVDVPLTDEDPAMFRERR